MGITNWSNTCYLNAVPGQRTHPLRRNFSVQEAASDDDLMETQAQVLHGGDTLSDGQRLRLITYLFTLESNLKSNLKCILLHSLPFYT